LGSCVLLACASCLPNGPPTGLADAGPTTTVPKPHVATPAASGSAAKIAANDPPITEVFEDEFERGAPGSEYRIVGPNWRIQDGKLCGKNAHNKGIWLAKRIPTNARIEFEATSQSADGDIKAEVWGDGMSGATSQSYSNASSYLPIYGAHKNTEHMLARLDEHSSDRKTIKVDPTDDDPRAQPVAVGQPYHFRIERSDGRILSFYVDDVLIHRWADNAPLEGPGHDHVGFNDWEAPVCFDHLKITPLP
jgi:hypothetical protein